MDKKFTTFQGLIQPGDARTPSSSDVVTKAHTMRTEEAQPNVCVKCSRNLRDYTSRFFSPQNLHKKMHVILYKLLFGRQI